MDTPKLILTKTPKNATIIEGFPGIGIVSTITTGFLIEHLDCEKIGAYHFPNMGPVIVLNQGNVIEPLSLYYNKKYNLVIMHAVTAPRGLEWDAAALVMQLSEQVRAKEIISIEGIGSNNPAEQQGFYFTHDEKRTKEFAKLGINRLNNGVIVGVTAALLMQAQDLMTCVFSQAFPNLPDSKAAARIIEILDRYLGLEVDYKPLLAQASALENQIKNVIQESAKAKEIKDQKQATYIG